MILVWNEEIKKSLGGCGSSVYIGHSVIFIHPEKVFLSDRVRIDPFTLVTSGLRTGSNCQICSHVVIGGGSDHTVTLGDWTFIGYGSKLFCASESYDGEGGPVNQFWNPSNIIYRGDIRFSSFSGVASNVTVFPGVTLPEGCTVGTHSLVTKSPTAPFSIYKGVPAVFWKWRNQEAIMRKANEIGLSNHDPRRISDCGSESV